jgi:hypothetical protein
MRRQLGVSGKAVRTSTKVLRWALSLACLAVETSMREGELNEAREQGRG